MRLAELSIRQLHPSGGLGIRSTLTLDPPYIPLLARFGKLPFPAEVMGIR